MIFDWSEADRLAAFRRVREELRICVAAEHPAFETPSGPPVRAIVKWYNPDKGFGFVELADGSGDAFL